MVMFQSEKQLLLLNSKKDVLTEYSNPEWRADHFSYVNRSCRARGIGVIPGSVGRLEAKRYPRLASFK